MPPNRKHFPATINGFRGQSLRPSLGCSCRLLCLCALLWVVSACGTEDSGHRSSVVSDRQAQVAAAGSDVMPFDLDRTTHVFEKTESGGVQYVISDDGEPAQISLIRQHLELEASKFAEGDFHDPEMIHGPEMPGLHALVVGHQRLVVTYEEVEAGGRILYSTEDETLVGALHQWFDAQLSDHGHHAQAHP